MSTDQRPWWHVVVVARRIVVEVLQCTQSAGIAHAARAVVTGAKTCTPRRAAEPTRGDLRARADQSQTSSTTTLAGDTVAVEQRGVTAVVGAARTHADAALSGCAEDRMLHRQSHRQNCSRHCGCFPRDDRQRAAAAQLPAVVATPPRWQRERCGERRCQGHRTRAWSARAAATRALAMESPSLMTRPTREARLATARAMQ